jgi:nucleoside-diphosphate-sugar epimerase
MTRALVTGCAGFIGSHLTESLLAYGIDVVGIDCFNDNYGSQTKQDNLEGPRSYHLAAEPGVRTSWGGRFGASMLGGEELCDVYHREEIGTVALRFFSVYGPRQRPDMAFHAFCRAIVRREPLHVLGTGAQTRDFTYVDDVVRALRAAAIARGVEGRAYNVGGGAQVSVNEAIERLAELAGRPLDVRREPRAAGDVRDTAADISRARVALGYEPIVGVADGLAAELAWMEARERTGTRLPKIRPVL